ncbi:MAG: hypothetical protein IT348_19325 [Candidatus Eisenbacteria bacterium]|nr:hypothetical protein [Candidatus Eisenbacteria bacterium]
MGVMSQGVIPKDAAGPTGRLNCRVRESPAASETRLLDRVRASCRLRHFSRRTEDAYVGWVRHFEPFHGTLHLAHIELTKRTTNGRFPATRTRDSIVEPSVGEILFKGTVRVAAQPIIQPDAAR